MKVLVHTLDSNSHFEYFRRFFTGNVSPDVVVTHLVARPKVQAPAGFLPSIYNRIMLEKRLYKMAKRNNEVVCFVANRFRMLTCKKVKTEYDQKKAEFIRDSFESIMGDYPKINDENIHYIENINDEAELINKISPDLLIVVGAPFIRSHILKLVDDKINLHIGYLPKYRGILCNEHAYLEGNLNEIGYTVHELSNELDKGWIYERKAYQISKDKFHIGLIYVQAYIDSFKKILQYVDDKDRAREYVKYNEGRLFNSYKFNPKNYRFLLNNCFNDASD